MIYQSPLYCNCIVHQYTHNTGTQLPSDCDSFHHDVDLAADNQRATLPSQHQGSRVGVWQPLGELPAPDYL